MLQFIDSYLRVIFQEKEWSWSIAALIYLIAALMIRRSVMSPLTRKVKELTKKDHQDLKKYYLSRAIWGWIFFILGGIFAVSIWQNQVSFPFDPSESQMIVGLIISYLFGLISHLIALGSAALHVLQLHKDAFRP